MKTMAREAPLVAALVPRDITGTWEERNDEVILPYLYLL
jgi:hypothetical protein